MIQSRGFFAIFHLQKPSPYSNCQQSIHIKINKTVFYFFKINLQSIFPFQMLKDERFYLD
ncbi:hypothetical protein NEISUBOT_05521 [Neisseria subflava NJ9703]|uniref:Uncharacterized protein n=1 Tax=Neisseria subflava NJ9703 TaxID=546268 RepID=A0A9W5IP28_NEISU|nr:hypothetical protein NEISUBOT_05521 [Neisseria subflava NJ9703]